MTKMGYTGLAETRESETAITRYSAGGDRPVLTTRSTRKLRPVDSSAGLP